MKICNFVNIFIFIFHFPGHVSLQKDLISAPPPQSNVEGLFWISEDFKNLQTEFEDVFFFPQGVFSSKKICLRIPQIKNTHPKKKCAFNGGIIGLFYKDM